MKNLTPLAKILIAAVILGALIGGYKLFKGSSVYSSIVPKAKIELPEGVSRDTPVVRVGVVTWGGYAGGEYFNEGFKANTESRFYKDYKVLVDFVVLDDFGPSRDAWKSGDVDMLWVTADALPTEVEGLKEYEPKFIFQADWSRGGDAIVVRQGIKSANDLKGKKIAVAFGTPSHTFLIWMLKAAGLPANSVQIIEQKSAVDAAATFKAGGVDAAVVWSPDDADCVAHVPGATILKSTKTASNIIADGFLVKGKYLEKNKEMIQHVVEGWLIGNAEINASDAAKKKAAKILSDGLNQPIDFCLTALSNVRLATYGDNANFFDLNGTYSGVKGEDLYTNMSIEYARLNLAPGRVAGWRQVTDTSLLRSIPLSGAKHAAEGTAVFSAADSSAKTAEAFSTKRVTVTYASGSATLSDEARVTIDREFGDIAKAFGNNRVRIVGNTDSIGDARANKVLSERRANAVADYLASRYKFSRNRFVIVGNGPDSPVADNTTDNGRALNRRTDFELMQ